MKNKYCHWDHDKTTLQVVGSCIICDALNRQREDMEKEIDSGEFLQGLSEAIGEVYWNFGNSNRPEWTEVNDDVTSKVVSYLKQSLRKENQP